MLCSSVQVNKLFMVNQFTAVARKGHYNSFVLLKLSRDNFNLSRDKFKLSRDNQSVYRALSLNYRAIISQSIAREV